MRGVEYHATEGSVIADRAELEKRWADALAAALDCDDLTVFDYPCDRRGAQCGSLLRHWPECAALREARRVA